MTEPLEPEGDEQPQRAMPPMPRETPLSSLSFDRASHPRRNQQRGRLEFGSPRKIPIATMLLYLVGCLLATTGSTVAEAAAAAGRPPNTIAARPQQQQRRRRRPTGGGGGGPSALYLWGNFGHVPDPLPSNERLRLWWSRTVVGAVRRRCRSLGETTISGWLDRGVWFFRSWVFWYFSKDCLASIYEDKWHAERDPDAFFGSEGMWISKGAHKDVVRRRIQRSKRNRQWVGLGYTPRLVWLVGVLLRGTFQNTAIPKVFNPSLAGWGAGTILGAKCTHQEWIATFMIGWFGSEHYWRILFGCNGPPYPKPGFVGVPVFITKLRIL